MVTVEREWIRIAGNSKRIKAGTPPYWRCQIGAYRENIPLVGWTVQGEVTLKNHRQYTNPGAVEPEYSAWIEYFGDMEVNGDGIAHIQLQDPSAT